MSVLVTCPVCRCAGNVPDTYAGRKVRCKHCGAGIAVSALPATTLYPPPVRRRPRAVVLPAPDPVAVNVTEAPREQPAPVHVIVHQEVKVRGGYGFGMPGFFWPWHLFHGILTTLTCGLWGPIWIMHYIVWYTAMQGRG